MNQKPLPPKIEGRLAELVQLGEFDQGDVRHCRDAYWGARDAWHTILIDCYDRARDRAPRARYVAQQQDKTNETETA